MILKMGDSVNILLNALPQREQIVLQVCQSKSYINMLLIMA